MPYNIKRIVKNLLFTLIVIVLLIVLYIYLPKGFAEVSKAKASGIFSTGQKLAGYYLVKYNWYDNYSKKNYSIDLKIPNTLVKSLRQSVAQNFISEYTPMIDDDRIRYYNRLYRYCQEALNSREILKQTADQFSNLSRLNTISEKTKRAYQVLTFVERLTYIVFYYEDHSHHVIKGDTLFCTRYCSSDMDDCMRRFHPERAKFGKDVDPGILTCCEFLKYRKGDCDTKTNLAYALLKMMDYDVVIVNIRWKGGGVHSLLGISDLNVYGKGNHRFRVPGNPATYYYVELSRNFFVKIGEMDCKLSDFDPLYIAMPNVVPIVYTQFPRK